MKAERSLIDQCHSRRPGLPAAMDRACAPRAAHRCLNLLHPIHASAAHARTPGWKLSHIIDQAEGHIQ
jgi:hypothetical protein